MKSASGTQQISSAYCKECSLEITGEYISANHSSYHLPCFRCLDCGIPVAEKFFPLTNSSNVIQIFCENDYFKRLDLLCSKCGQALRGPHINALGKKFHIDHFTCSVYLLLI